ncbi:unnamed protein product [Symbiodinium natans]|uniref:Mechanosensitive ion channel MscS domain-containing protein n=1 Tax=Symbiodinium natans TaxID=878477 RepID=A0A812FYQ9_9DINO|nr:unnamed protein product [Symbiodinium natans]
MGTLNPIIEDMEDTEISSWKGVFHRQRSGSSSGRYRWCCCRCCPRFRRFSLHEQLLLSPEADSLSASPSWKLKRLQESIDNGVHALGVGLGGAMPRVSKFARAQTVRFKDMVATPTNIALLLGFAVSMPVSVGLNYTRAYTLNETIFKTDINSRTEALSRLAAIPVVCASINWFVQHLRKTVFFWERRNEDRFLPLYTGRHSWWDLWSLGPMTMASLFLIRNACCHMLEDHVAEQVYFCFTGGMVLLAVYGYFMVLDKIDDNVQNMIMDQEIINQSKCVQKMQDIVTKNTRTHKKDRDIVYSFAHTHTVPAKVLHYIWSIYYLVGKILGALIVIAYFAQIDADTINRFVLGSLLLSGAASGGFMLELGPSTISLLRIALYKPFYVGDLVTLNHTGASGMQNALVGFVENITMMYVVIRNFEMKQVWVSHKAFNELIIQNWTRRPTKTVLLNIGISTRSPLQKVQRLQEFGKRWIKESPDIQQDNYQKCHITSTSNGYNIEIIFFPMVGVSHRQIRQKFLIAFMEAAQRLNVPFVPLQIVQNFCEDVDPGGVEAMSAATSVAKEVGLDDLMPDPNDRLERGKE